MHHVLGGMGVKMILEGWEAEFEWMQVFGIQPSEKHCVTFT